MSKSIDPCVDCRRECEIPCWKVEHGLLRPVVRGEWVLINDHVNIGDGCHMECSVCGVWKRDRIKSPFCQECGADMRGGESNA